MDDERRRCVLGSDKILDKINDQLTDIKVEQEGIKTQVDITAQEVHSTRDEIKALIPQVVTNTNFRKAMVRGMSILVGGGALAAGIGKLTGYF